MSYIVWVGGAGLTIVVACLGWIVQEAKQSGNSGKHGGKELVEKVGILKDLRMGLPTMETLSGLCGDMFSLFRTPKSIMGNKQKHIQFYQMFRSSPIFLYGY